MTEKTVRLGYSSSQNISFVGTIETGISRSDWDKMSGIERDVEMSDCLHELVEVFELSDDEPDYTGRMGRR